MKLRYGFVSQSRDRLGVVTKEVKGCLRISKWVKGYLRGQRISKVVKRVFFWSV